MLTSIVGLLAGIVAVSLAGFLSARGAAQLRRRTKQPTRLSRQTVEIRPARRDQESSGNRENPEAMKSAASGKTNDGFPLASTGSR